MKSEKKRKPLCLFAMLLCTNQFSLLCLISCVYEKENVFAFLSEKKGVILIFNESFICVFLLASLAFSWYIYAGSQASFRINFTVTRVHT